MTLRGDDRAVTVQIGAVILLGFLVVSLSLYQATIVPNQNRQVEFQHNQRVQADLLELRNAILDTAASGSSAPVGVALGTEYPTRIIAVNPAPPSGTLSTSSLGAIEVRNATADNAATGGADFPETADFWNGTTHTYQTKSLVYRPSYANYDAAPTTVYENSVLYNRFRSGNVTRSGQSLVAGTRISLVALSGNLSRGGAGTLSVDPQAVSVSTRTISVTNDTAGENVSVVVPSKLSADTWRGLLNETGDYDPAANSTDGAHVYRVAERPNGVELYFEPGTSYQLKLSKVGVGSSVEDTQPAYLTSTDDVAANPFVGRTYPFVVEARDKYNNPTATSVEAASESGIVPEGTVLEAGRYRYQYTAPWSLGADWVNATSLTGSGAPADDPTSASFDGSKAGNVQYETVVQRGEGAGGPLALEPGSGTALAGGETTGIQFLINNKATETVTIEQITLSNPSNGAIAVWEGNTGAGNGNREVFIDVGDDGAGTENAEDGYYESGDQNINDNWQIGTTGDLTTGDDDPAALSGSQSARFYIYEFYSSTSGGGTTIDMSGETITVTLTVTVGNTEYTESYEVTATAP